MKIEIAKTDLFALSEILRMAIWKMENCPNPSAWGKFPTSGRKVYKSIVKAHIKAFGKGCLADESFFPNSKKSDEKSVAKLAN